MDNRLIDLIMNLRICYDKSIEIQLFKELLKTKLLDFLTDIVIINRYYVKEGRPFNYLSPLWADITE